MIAKLLYILIGLGVFVCVMFAMMGWQSHSGKPAGLIDRKLSVCGSKPNCVSTEVADGPEALTLDPEWMEEAWVDIRSVVEAAGGALTVYDDEYLAAEFTSRIFRFVDDFEARFDSANARIQMRSASRVGYSDLGVNAARLERIRVLFNDRETGRNSQ